MNKASKTVLVVLLCPLIFLFMGLELMSRGFALLSKTVVAAPKRVYRSLTRFPTAMLLQSAVRQECWEYVRKHYQDLLNPAIMGAALFLTFMTKIVLDSSGLRSAFTIGGWIFGPPEIMFLLASIPLCFWPIRQRVLVPAHLKQRLEKARSRFSKCAEEYNLRVPDHRYRLPALPQAKSDDICTLKQVLDERRLPNDLEPRALRVIEAYQEMSEAEVEHVSACSPQSRTITDPT